MICTQFCIVLIFKLPLEHLLRVKNNNSNNPENLFYQLSIALQRGNVVAFLNTFDSN